jgi:hypothetical protein
LSVLTILYKNEGVQNPNFRICEWI